MQKARQAFAKFAAQAQKASAGGGGGGGSIGRAVSVALGLGITGFGVFHSIVIVQPGHGGFAYNRLTYDMENTATLRVGINFVIPWLHQPVIFDIRTRSLTHEVRTGSKDLQIVKISLRVLYRPDPNQLLFIYRHLGNDKDYGNVLLPSTVNEATKSVVAKHNAFELLANREEVSAAICKALVRRSNDWKVIVEDVIVEDVSITNLTFSN